MDKLYAPCFGFSFVFTVVGLASYFGDKNFAVGIVFLSLSGLIFLLGLTLLITSTIDRLTEAINNKNS